MSVYEKEHSFAFKVRQYAKLGKKLIKLCLFTEIILIALLFVNTDFVGLNGEPIATRITIKYFASYLYPDNPETERGWLELDQQLLKYTEYAAPAAKPFIADKVQNIVYRYVADLATDGQYTQLVTNLQRTVYIAPLIPFIYFLIFLYRGSIPDDEKFLRGSSLIHIKTFNEKLRKIDAGAGGFRIGDTILPPELETKHTLILGTSGSGKGVLLNQLAAQINQRKNRQNLDVKTVFYDTKGEFVSKQWLPSDIIFSPFDTRFCGWSFFNEFTTEPELDVLSKSLFATDNTKNAFFYSSAASIFKGGILCLASQNQTRNEDIWNFFTQTTEEIAKEIKKLPTENQEALKFLGADETTASIMATLTNRIEFFKYLRGLDGDFSFRNWVIDGRQNIFMLNVEEYSNIFKPLMTMAIDLLSRSVLSLPDDKNRRIFFILDELGTLDRMDSLLQLITVGRSKGAAIICASQDLGRIEQAYGKANLKTIFNNFNINFFFRLGEPETSRYVSSALGQRQLKRKTQSHNINAKESDNEGINEQNTTEDLIMPSELLNLPDLTAFCRVANVGITQIVLPKIFYPVKNKPFQKRTFASIYSIQQVETTNTAAVVEANNEVIAEVKPAVKFKKM